MPNSSHSSTYSSTAKSRRRRSASVQKTATSSAQDGNLLCEVVLGFTDSVASKGGPKTMELEFPGLGVRIPIKLYAMRRIRTNATRGFELVQNNLATFATSELGSYFVGSSAEDLKIRVYPISELRGPHALRLNKQEVELKRPKLLLAMDILYKIEVYAISPLKKGYGLTELPFLTPNHHAREQLQPMDPRVPSYSEETLVTTAAPPRPARLPSHGTGKVSNKLKNGRAQPCVKKPSRRTSGAKVNARSPPLRLSSQGSSSSSKSTNTLQFELVDKIKTEPTGPDLKPPVAEGEEGIKDWDQTPSMKEECIEDWDQRPFTSPPFKREMSQDSIGALSMSEDKVIQLSLDSPSTPKFLDDFDDQCGMEVSKNLETSTPPPSHLLRTSSWALPALPPLPPPQQPVINSEPSIMHLDLKSNSGIAPVNSSFLSTWPGLSDLQSYPSDLEDLSSCSMLLRDTSLPLPLGTSDSSSSEFYSEKVGPSLDTPPRAHPTVEREDFNLTSPMRMPDWPNDNDFPTLWSQHSS
eukprot:g13983.t1